MVKRFYMFLIEFLKELPFLIVIAILIWFAMGYSGVGIESAFEYKVTNTATNKYAQNSYLIDFNKDLYGKPGFEDKDIAYYYNTSFDLGGNNIDVCEINENILKIYDIHNKNLFTKTNLVEQDNNSVREALALPQFADKYKVGDIYMPHELTVNYKINYPIKIVGYINEKTHFIGQSYTFNYQFLIYNHVAGIEFPRQNNANFHVYAEQGRSFYTDNYQPYECKISPTNISEEYENSMADSKDYAKSTLYGCMILIGVFVMVMLLYAACKNDFYAKKFAVYNLYGEKKSTRFIMEMIKTLIVVAIPSAIQYVIYISTSFYSSTSKLWTMSNTINLIMMLVIAISFILINTAVNMQIFFRKSTKKIGE